MCTLFIIKCFNVVCSHSLILFFFWVCSTRFAIWKLKKPKWREKKNRMLTNKWLVSESSKFKGDIFRVFDDIFNINFVQIKVSKQYIDRACHIYMHEIICPSLEKEDSLANWNHLRGSDFPYFFFLVLSFIWSGNLSSLSNCHIAKVIIIIIVKTEQSNQRHTVPYIFIK